MLTTPLRALTTRIMLTQDKVIDILRSRCSAAGSLRAFARENYLSAAYVSDVLRGNRAPGPTICVALGIEPTIRRVVEYTYRRKRKD